MRTLYGSWRLSGSRGKSARRAKSAHAIGARDGWIPLLLAACQAGSTVAEPRVVTQEAPAPTEIKETAASGDGSNPNVSASWNMDNPPAAASAAQGVGSAIDNPLTAPNVAQDWGGTIEGRVTQLLTTPVTHLTAGKRRGAALGADTSGALALAVFALDAASIAGHPAVPLSRPAPAELTNSNAMLGLFMGRDDWPRVITASERNGQHYFRFRPTPGWESPRDEQGGLVQAGSAAGFYGVLGHEDPEVLCSPEAFCYEKRQSGWHKRATPGAGAWNMLRLSNGEAWAWSNSTPQALCRLDKTWDCSLPHPGATVVSLAYVNGTYLALTSAGLMSYAGAWMLVASLPSGRALVTFESKALIVTTEGVWVWDGQLHRVHVKGTTLNGGCCAESPVGSRNAFIIGGEQGAMRLTFD